MGPFRPSREEHFQSSHREKQPLHLPQLDSPPHVKHQSSQHMKYRHDDEDVKRQVDSVTQKPFSPCSPSVLPLSQPHLPNWTSCQERHHSTYEREREENMPGSLDVFARPKKGATAGAYPFIALNHQIGHCPQSSSLPSLTDSFRRLGALPREVEDFFEKLLSDLPPMHRHSKPTAPSLLLTPAFDLGTLKRQVLDLQKEVSRLYNDQECLFKQNKQLWEQLRGICQAPEFVAAEGQVEQVHAALLERQAELEALQEFLRQTPDIEAHLWTVREDRERAREILSLAHGGSAEAAHALTLVMGENKALEEELMQQTVVLENLQEYLIKCRVAQQEEDMEELEEVAARMHAASASCLRRRRKVFSFLRLAAWRARQMREIASRFEVASVKCLALKALTALAEHRRVGQKVRQARQKREGTLVRQVVAAWQHHVYEEQLARLADRRRVFRHCLVGWRQATREGQRHHRIEVKRQRLQEQRLAVDVFKSWHRVMLLATASSRDGVRRAILAWQRRAWRNFCLRVGQRERECGLPGQELTSSGLISCHVCKIEPERRGPRASRGQVQVLLPTQRIRYVKT